MLDSMLMPRPGGVIAEQEGSGLPPTTSGDRADPHIGETHIEMPGSAGAPSDFAVTQPALGLSRLAVCTDRSTPFLKHCRRKAVGDCLAYVRG